MKLFFDLEFTGLHKETTPISIAFTSEQNHEFYAEFTDYSIKQVYNDKWLLDNVLKHRKFHSIFDQHYRLYHNLDIKPYSGTKGIYGDTKFIKKHLEEYLKQFDKIEIWGDCLGYDWVLFCQIFGGAMKIPGNVYYIPFDICTLFKVVNVDPDINREKFVEYEPSPEQKHRADWDALVIKACHHKLSNMIRIAMGKDRRWI